MAPRQKILGHSGARKSPHTGTRAFNLPNRYGFASREVRGGVEWLGEHSCGSDSEANFQRRGLTTEDISNLLKSRVTTYGAQGA